MESVISIRGLNKRYKSGHQALTDIDLEIKKGEIFALLGPNGAGKTTLISAICGIVTPTSGEILVADQNVVSEYRKTRSMIGLVPQELTGDAFESVWSTVNFSRGLFGKPRDPAFIERLLKQLSLWDKKDDRLMALSGGMKRRVLIAKALSHEPEVLFLDEPTAGVDVELRKDMWDLVAELRTSGVTIILTTHYIEEAEEMADRIGVINQGKIILVEDKSTLMEKLGEKQIRLHLRRPLSQLPEELSSYPLKLTENGELLIYSFATQTEHTGITELLRELEKHQIDFKDMQSSQSSLEDIFVNLVRKSA